ncbi:MAG: hypothetical protein ABIG30_03365 [Candidatus Aenigmatarchaeota archaeon]
MKKSTRHTSRKNGKHLHRASNAKKLRENDLGIIRCSSCKDGRIIRARGLVFCGFCGKEYVE